MVVVTFLYFRDCPNWLETRARLDEALTRVGLPDSVVVLQAVETAEEAHQVGFRGSPTILLDGRDPFPAPNSSVGLSCRIFATPDGLAGAPTVAQLVEALVR